MKRLTCEMCGSTDLIKEDGVFVCQSCGCKYSVEEAKKMMIEGPVDVSGSTVIVDNTHMIDNWMKMAASEGKLGHDSEAHKYYSKVLEVDPENWRAIFERGKIDAWSDFYSTRYPNRKKPKIYELNRCIDRAQEIIDQTGMDETSLEKIKKEFAWALASAYYESAGIDRQQIQIRRDLFYFNGYMEDFNLLSSSSSDYFSYVNQLEKVIAIDSKFDDDISRESVIANMKRMCDAIRDACLPFRLWRDQARRTYTYYTGSQKKYLDKYLDLVDKIREVEPEFGKDPYGYPYPFSIGPELHTQQECNSYWQNIITKRAKQFQEQQAKKRFDAYWENHSEEKQQYLTRVSEIDSELETLNEQLESYNSRISAINAKLDIPLPHERELKEVEKQISDLKQQKSNLGLFAGKRKKELQAQIDDLQVQADGYKETIEQEKAPIINDVTAKAAAVRQESMPTKVEISKLEAEKRDIQNELSRAR